MHDRNWLLVILIVGTALRWYSLDAKSLWYDEAISAASLSFSYGEIISRKAGAASVHPPLYFVLLKGWAEIFGESELALRSLAAVFGVFTIIGMYFFMRALCRLGKMNPSVAMRVSLWSAFLTATSPLQIISSQQVRGYSLGTALLVWSSWALMLALIDSGRRRTIGWILWAILTVLFCYTSNLAVLSVVGQGLFAGCFFLASHRRPGRSQDRSSMRINDSDCPSNDVGKPACQQLTSQSRFPKAALVAVIIIIIGYGLPWGSRLWSQSTTVRTTTAINRPLKIYQIPQEIHRSIVASWASKRSRNNALIWTTTILLEALFIYVGYRGGWPGWYLVLTGLIPVMLIILFSAISNRSIVQARYFTFAHLMWLGAFALAFFQIQWRPALATVEYLTLIGCAYFVCANWNIIGPAHNGGMRAAVHYVLKNRDAGELFIARDHHVFFGMDYYTADNASPKLLVNRLDRSVLRAGHELKDSDLITPRSLLRSEIDGVWIVKTNSYNTAGRAEFAIPKCWTLVEDRSFEQDFFWEEPVDVLHYRFPKGGPRCEEEPHQNIGME